MKMRMLTNNFTVNVTAAFAWLIFFLIIVFIVVLAAIYYKTKELKDLNQNIKNTQELFEKDISIAKMNLKVELDSIQRNRLSEIGRIMEEKEKELLASYAEEVKSITQKLNQYQSSENARITTELRQKHTEELQKHSEELKRKMSDEEVRMGKILSEKTQEHSENIQKLNDSLEILKSREHAAIKSRIEKFGERSDSNCISISLQDAAEIAKIEEVVHLFRNPMPLRKAVFEIYYKEAVKDLINLLTQGKRITGIYKITHNESGKCYIGQSVDIGNRWMQHCKRGAGADSPTGSKLYPEMLKYGIHNFSFEIVEEVNDSQLGAAEKYWAEFYGSKIFGYSIKN